MSDKYIITKEEINQILLHSPYALSTTPAKNGMGGEQIKKYFYDYIRVLVEKLNLRMNDIEAGIDESSSMHDSAPDSHKDLREAVKSLDTAVQGAYSEAERACSLAREGVAEVNNALQAVLGRRTVYFERTMQLALGAVAFQSYQFNEGDMIIVGALNVPELIAFKADSEALQDAILITDEQIQKGTFYIVPGGQYRFENSEFGVVAIDGGVDANNIVTPQNLTNAINGVQTAINKAETDANKYTDTKIAEYSATANNTFATRDELETVESIAKGANQAISFRDYEEMQTELKKLKADDLMIGQSIFIGEKEVPDVWVYEKQADYETITHSAEIMLTKFINGATVGIGYFILSALETQKVDLTEYATKEDSVTPQNLTNALNGVQTAINKAETDANKYTDTKIAEYSATANNTFATKDELGDVEATLDSIIAIQNTLIGGDAE